MAFHRGSKVKNKFFRIARHARNSSTIALPVIVVKFYLVVRWFTYLNRNQNKTENILRKNKIEDTNSSRDMAFHRGSKVKNKFFRIARHARNSSTIALPVIVVKFYLVVRWFTINHQFSIGVGQYCYCVSFICQFGMLFKNAMDKQRGKLFLSNSCRDD